MACVAKAPAPAAAEVRSERLLAPRHRRRVADGGQHADAGVNLRFLNAIVSAPCPPMECPVMKMSPFAAGSHAVHQRGHILRHVRVRPSRRAPRRFSRVHVETSAGAKVVPVLLPRYPRHFRPAQARIRGLVIDPASAHAVNGLPFCTAVSSVHVMPLR